MKGQSQIIMNGVKVAGGFLAGKFVSNIGFVQANPMLRIAVPIVGAVLAKSFLGNNSAPIAAGMVVAGVTNAIQQFAPGLATQAGLGGPAVKSLYYPGVSGIGAQFQPQNQEAPAIRV